MRHRTKVETKIVITGNLVHPMHQVWTRRGGIHSSWKHWGSFRDPGKARMFSKQLEDGIL